jgi:hypothetical protein
MATASRFAQKKSRRPRTSKWYVSLFVSSGRQNHGALAQLPSLLVPVLLFKCHKIPDKRPHPLCSCQLFVLCLVSLKPFLMYKASCLVSYTNFYSADTDMRLKRSTSTSVLSDTMFFACARCMPCLFFINGACGGSQRPRRRRRNLHGRFLDAKCWTRPQSAA